MNAFKYIAFLLLCCTIQETKAQVSILRIIADAPLPFQWNDTIFADHKLRSQAEIKIVQNLHKLGYIASSVDSIYESENTRYLWLHVGAPYSWFNVRHDSIPMLFKLKEGVLPFENGKKVNLDAFKRWADQVLTAAENRGYPFAQIRLDSVVLGLNGRLEASVHLDVHTFFTMDSIQIWGDTLVNRNFLYNYLGFRPGDPYSEQKIADIDRKLDQLSFLKRTDPTRIYFIYNKVVVVVRIEERKSSRFDGIVGFAPNSSNNDSRLLLTGELNLDMQNVFKNGSYTSMFWKSFLQNSQELRVKAGTPFLLKTPLGTDAGLDFTRFDTLFTDLTARMGFSYQLSGGGRIGFVFQQRNTGLIGFDTALVRRTGQLPNGNPSVSRMYGLNWQQSRLNDLLTPQKGFRVLIDASGGNKQILRDVRIDAVQFNNAVGEIYSLYDSLEEKVVQWSIGYQLEQFLPLRKKGVVALSVQGRHWLSSRIFFNELYRFGGYATLRGFDEQAFLANSFVIPSAEFRYIFAENAWAGIFVNVAWYQRSLWSSESIQDTPYGFGISARIPAGNGLLNLAYALGSEQGNPIQFRSAKVHFGLLNYF